MLKKFSFITITLYLLQCTCLFNFPRVYVHRGTDRNDER